MPSLYLKRKNTIPFFFIQVEKWRTFLLIFSRSREREWDQTRKDSPTFSHLYDFSLIGIVLCKWFTGNTINWQEKKILISLQKRKMQQVVKKNLILTVLICFFFLSCLIELIYQRLFRCFFVVTSENIYYWYYYYSYFEYMTLHVRPHQSSALRPKNILKKRRKNKTIWKIKGI